MTAVAKSNGRYDHIDSLRAIAALLVIWMHVSEVFATLNSPVIGIDWFLVTTSSYLDFGRVGVLVFFLISGFLIPSSLKGSIKEGSKKFVVRRFFRLFPLYWASIPLGVVAMWLLYDKPISGWDIALNFTMLQDVFSAQSVSGLYWTLKIELYFYCLCLGLFCLNLLNRENVIIYLAAGIIPTQFLIKIATGHEVNIWGVWSSDLAFLSFMFLGALWRRAHDREIRTLGKLTLAGTTAWFGIVFPLSAAFLYIRDGSLHLDHSRLFFGYSLAVLIFVISSMIWRIRSPILAWMGRISYSMYLLHPVIFYTIYWYIINLSADSAVRSIGVGIYLIIIMLIVVLISAMTYMFIEAPMIKWGVRLTSRSLILRDLGRLNQT